MLSFSSIRKWQTIFWKRDHSVPYPTPRFSIVNIITIIGFIRIFTQKSASPPYRYLWSLSQIPMLPIIHSNIINITLTHILILKFFAFCFMGIISIIGFWFGRPIWLLILIVGIWGGKLCFFHLGFEEKLGFGRFGLLILMGEEWNWENWKSGALRVLLVMGFYWGPSDLDRIRLLSCQVGGGWNGSLRIWGQIMCFGIRFRIKRLASVTFVHILNFHMCN